MAADRVRSGFVNVMTAIIPPATNRSTSADPSQIQSFDRHAGLQVAAFKQHNVVLRTALGAPPRRKGGSEDSSARQ